MKTTLLRTLLAAVGLFVFAAQTARAATAPNEATVLQLTGSAQVVRAPGQAPVALRVGDKLPQGATIITGAGATVHIQPFAGAVSTVNENTEVSLDKLSLDTNNAGRVTKQTALLKLKSGNVVSILNPNNKDINDYGVSTPKGVAAARGTQFTSSVTAANGTVISANADTVQFTDANGGTVTISQGRVTIIPANAPADYVPVTLSLASLANNNTPDGIAAKAAIQAGVTALAQVLANNVGDLGTAAATDLAVKVAGVAAEADPSTAVASTKTIVTAMQSPNSPTQGDSTAVAKVTASAVIGAPNQTRAIIEEISTLTGKSVPDLNREVASEREEIKKLTEQINDFPSQPANTENTSTTL
jgi:hypothetical protein